jgi:hypothetical protein
MYVKPMNSLCISKTIAKIARLHSRTLMDDSSLNLIFYTAGLIDIAGIASFAFLHGEKYCIENESEYVKSILPRTRPVYDLQRM